MSVHVYVSPESDDFLLMLYDSILCCRIFCSHTTSFVRDYWMLFISNNTWHYTVDYNMEDVFTTCIFFLQNIRTTKYRVNKNIKAKSHIKSFIMFTNYLPQTKMLHVVLKHVNYFLVLSVTKFYALWIPVNVRLCGSVIWVSVPVVINFWFGDKGRRMHPDTE